MDHEVGNLVISEIEAIFEKHNVVGVVSFVRLVNIQRTDTVKTFDMEGGAGVFMSAEADDNCMIAALDYVADQQECVASAIKECKVEIKDRAKFSRTAN